MGVGVAVAAEAMIELASLWMAARFWRSIEGYAFRAPIARSPRTLESSEVGSAVGVGVAAATAVSRSVTPSIGRDGVLVGTGMRVGMS